MSLRDELNAAFTSAGQSGAVMSPGTFSADEFAGLEDLKPLSKRARSRLGEAALTANERKRKSRAIKKADKIQHIAVLDLETDPFDTVVRDRIAPFAACLYSDRFAPIVIWEENEAKFIDALIKQIEDLPGEYTIFAHNGGKFDFMFLLHRLRGKISFKGRGIMSAKIGAHELRDSYHIIPEKLAAYKKDSFDYADMAKARRGNVKKQIIDYLISDCVYLFDIVKTFITNYGMKISIGQAAMALLKREYTDVKSLNSHNDLFLRGFFFGGRVECLSGRGFFRGDYKLYDVNSMYPDVMANMKHPIGDEYRPRKGKPSELTCFIDLNCYSYGAFPLRSVEHGTHFPHAFGRYRVSIHEYNVAVKYNRIKNVKINYVVDNDINTTFDRFILPLYNNRLLTKKRLKELEAQGDKTSIEYNNTKKDDIFYKLLMNNAYGKFAQNPRRFKQHYITDFDKAPDDGEDWGLYPEVQNSDYAIWARPLQKLRFNNVGTAASITGAARAVLLEAIINSSGALYCDTDSLICERLDNVTIDPVKLGAWDLETDMTEVLIAGKKLYAYRGGKKGEVIKCKGVASRSAQNTRGVDWGDMENIVRGQSVVVPAFAPTLTRRGTQGYIDRKISSTTEVKQNVAAR